MPSFTVRITQGVEVVDWNDPTGEIANSNFDAGRPAGPTNPATITVISRLNPVPGHPHLNYRTTVGRGVVIKATPDGEAEGAPDVDLGGRLFSHWFVEYPIGSGAVLSHAPGISSVVSFVPDIPGNYLLVFYREQGGSIAVPIEVVRPPEN